MTEMPKSVDVAIIGGGAMGSATAYYLSLMAPELAITVFEPDPTYEYSSTLRSDGNLRTQFNLAENILMSRYTMELLDTFADDMAIGGWRPDAAPRRQGNLFLTDAAGREAAMEGIAAQRSLDCSVEWLDAGQIVARWPALRTEGIVGGTFGPFDGSIDPQAVLHAFRRNAMGQGVAYVSDRVEQIHTADGRIAGIETAAGGNVAAPIVVNCAGGWASELAAGVGVEIPVTPTMRTVFTVDAPVAAADLPSVFLPSGPYLIPEAGNTFSMAWSRPSDPVGFDFTFRRTEFEVAVWPEIIATLPEFDRLAVKGGWTGIYALNTLDGNAILGEWPLIGGFYLANGFSGHGFQHCPAVGRYLAELIAGRPPTIDLSRLGPRRILERTPLHEHTGRII